MLCVPKSVPARKLAFGYRPICFRRPRETVAKMHKEGECVQNLVPLAIQCIASCSVFRKLFYFERSDSVPTHALVPARAAPRCCSDDLHASQAAVLQFSVSSTIFEEAARGCGNSMHRSISNYV